MASATLRIPAARVAMNAKGMRSSAVAPGAKALRAAPRAVQAVGRKGFFVKAASDDAFDGYEPKVAFLFPGQGAQSVGMAKALTEEVPAAKELFERANEILGYDLLDLCVNGPAEKLNTTEISQPAIYVSSLAAIEKLKTMEDGEEKLAACNVAAGLSLGEYSALAFADAMTFEDGLRLVKLRGESMQAAADMTPSAMASVIGLDSDKVAELCKRAAEESGADVTIANYLCPGNYAVSGGTAAIDAVEALAKPEFKARMAVRLAVAGAFHTSYMSPAVEKLMEGLEATTFTSPRIPVISNYDAAPHADPAVIKDILSKQIVSPVQWETTCKTLIEKGCEEAFEIGPGKVCAGIFKRVDKKFKVTNVEA